MAPAAQFPSGQSTTYTNPRAHLVFAVAPETGGAATQFYPALSDMHAN